MLGAKKLNLYGFATQTSKQWSNDPWGFRLVGWLVGRSVGRSVGGWVGGLVGWLVGCRCHWGFPYGNGISRRKLWLMG